MCGLVGIVKAAGHYARYKDFMTTLLYLDYVRGIHSTSLMCVDKEDPQRVLYYKKALIASDFLQLRATQSLLSSSHNYSVLAGHNRQATLGSISDANAHPFTHGDITLMHNGTIRAHQFGDYDKEVPKYIDVDSEKMTWLINEHGTEILPNILTDISRSGGAYVFLWHNKKEGTLNIIKNSKRSFYVSNVENKEDETFCWASEAWMLEGAGIHAKVELEEALPMSDGVLTKIKLPTEKEKGLSFEYIDLEIDETPKIHAVSNNHYYSGESASEHHKSSFKEFKCEYNDTIEIVGFDFIPISTYTRSAITMGKVYGMIMYEGKKQQYDEFIAFSVPEPVWELWKHCCFGETKPEWACTGKTIGTTKHFIEGHDVKDRAAENRVVIDPTSLRIYKHEHGIATMYQWNYTNKKIEEVVLGPSAVIEKEENTNEEDEDVEEVLNFFRGPNGEEFSEEDWNEASEKGCVDCGGAVTKDESFFVEEVLPNGIATYGLMCMECLLVEGVQQPLFRHEETGND